MAPKILRLSRLHLLLIMVSTLSITHCRAALAKRKIYIVYMGEHAGETFSSLSLHINMLKDVLSSDSAFNRTTASTSLLYSYKNFNGFVAQLTDEEKDKLAGMNGVISLFISENNELLTTKSWDFMGFSQQVERTPVESDVIVGIIDSGIWPNSSSFVDKDYSPPPSKWKGVCQASADFSCNNKIIGARFYRAHSHVWEEDTASPIDSSGHGTHTASTVAGEEVDMASLYGFGLGIARGGVSSARIAVYKACWSDGCYTHDILAAFDDAIADGVDIISVSIGPASTRDYFSDPIAIGSFHALKAGILTSCAAGNEGPTVSSVTNSAPWQLTVAASTTDRKFITPVQLGNGEVYEGVSINAFELNGSYPIIYAGDAPDNTVDKIGTLSRYCYKDSLNVTLVKDKIVICDGINNGLGAYLAGAAGMILRSSEYQDAADSFPLPASHIGLVEGEHVLEFLNSTSNPTATILKSREAKDSVAPFIASFSSRGPNRITRNILKPDIAAPGVQILAAWSPLTTVTNIKEDKRVVPYNILSGTSMACPHATAVAAYIKTFHPTWSPSAIKSALMTTAFSMSPNLNPEAEFAYGSGHINPTNATNPGLVYDANATDYINLLCGQDYSTEILQNITGDNTICSETTKGTVWDLNYPSFALHSETNASLNHTFSRTVTNVGSPVSVYYANVTAPPGLVIRVEPSVLSFVYSEQKLQYSVIVEGVIDKPLVSASLVWSDGVHHVRSPIVVYV